MAYDIYQEEILEHYRNPHNKGAMEHPDIFGHGNNPVCGDDITVYISVRDGVIVEAKFDGRGCAISQASASMFTDRLKGMKLEEALAMKDEDIRDMLHIPLSAVRMKCATLGLRVFKEAASEYAEG